MKAGTFLRGVGLGRLVFLLICIVWLGSSLEAFPQPGAENISDPALAISSREKGTVVLKVWFNSEGKVEKCWVTKSSVSKKLDEETGEYAIKYWQAPKYAGKTLYFSVVYSGAVDMPFPPYPMAALESRESGTVVVTVTFDAAGHVSQAHIVKSTGAPILGDFTCDFIKHHWFAKPLSGRTATIPVTFNADLSH
jgi:TonB family protein